MAGTNGSGLDATLLALADPTRRAILHRLARGDARVTELAHPFAMSLNAVSKHIRTLERASLVQRRRAGREHILSFNPEPLATAAAWIEERRAEWTARLAALDALLEAEDSANPEPGTPEKKDPTMTTDSPVIVRVTHRFRTSAERVFDAWLDADEAAKWMFATPTGQMVRAEVDPRVGGTYTFVDRRDGQDVVHTGEYLELDRPRRLVFTFAVDGSDADRIEVDIVALEAGCELTLTQEMRPEWAEYVDRTRQGWSMILDGLAASLGEGA